MTHADMQHKEHPRSLAREFVIQFLYQCECDNIYYFSANHFAGFATHFNLADRVKYYTEELATGCLSNMTDIDEKIQSCSKNWKIERMPITDRSILRMATFELMQQQTPAKVVLNEAIELAKKFGTKDSGAFVNGVLDHLLALIDPAAERHVPEE